MPTKKQGMTAQKADRDNKRAEVGGKTEPSEKRKNRRPQEDLTPPQTILADEKRCPPIDGSCKSQPLRSGGGGPNQEPRYTGGKRSASKAQGDAWK